jgi:hypothetical protein
MLNKFVKVLRPLAKLPFYMMEHEGEGLLEYMNEVLHDPNNEEEQKAVETVKRLYREYDSALSYNERIQHTSRYNTRSTGTLEQNKAALKLLNQTLDAVPFGCTSLPDCDGNRDGGPGCGNCVVLDLNNMVMKMERTLEGPHYNK